MAVDLTPEERRVALVALWRYRFVEGEAFDAIDIVDGPHMNEIAAIDLLDSAARKLGGDPSKELYGAAVVAETSRRTSRIATRDDERVRPSFAGVLLLVLVGCGGGDDGKSNNSSFSYECTDIDDAIASVPCGADGGPISP